MQGLLVSQLNDTPTNFAGQGEQPARDVGGRHDAKAAGQAEERWDNGSCQSVLCYCDEYGTLEESSTP